MNESQNFLPMASGNLFRHNDFINFIIKSVVLTQP